MATVIIADVEITGAIDKGRDLDGFVDFGGDGKDRANRCGNDEEPPDDLVIEVVVELEHQLKHLSGAGGWHLDPLVVPLYLGVPAP